MRMKPRDLQFPQCYEPKNTGASHCSGELLGPFPSLTLFPDVGRKVGRYSLWILVLRFLDCPHRPGHHHCNSGKIYRPLFLWSQFNWQGLWHSSSSPASCQAHISRFKRVMWTRQGSCSHSKAQLSFPLKLWGKGEKTLLPRERCCLGHGFLPVGVVRTWNSGMGSEKMVHKRQLEGLSQEESKEGRISKGKK